MPAYRVRRKHQWVPRLAGHVVGRAQMAGAQSACDVLDAYAENLNQGFQALEAQYQAAQVAGQPDLFGQGWTSTMIDWNAFYEDYACSWTNYVIPGYSALEDLRAELDAWNVTLRTWQERGQKQKGITPNVPAPPETPPLPETPADSVASTIKTVAISLAVVVGAIAVWKVADLVGD
jgi:hypothetical protein